MVLILGVVVLILAFGLIFMVQTESKLTNKFVDYTIAEQIAQTGVEQTLYYIKTDKDLNNRLIELMKDELEGALEVPESAIYEAQSLSSAGKYDLTLQVEYVPTESPYPGMGVYTGDIRIVSQGSYTNNLAQVSKREILAVYSVRAVNLGLIAPDHSLFIREREHLNYNFEDNFDPSDLGVFQGDVYIENGLTAELSDYNKRKMIEKGELTWQEYYYMDHPQETTGLADGGVDFLDCETIEYSRFGVYRKFKIFGADQKETYSKKVYPSSGYYNDDRINLRPLDFYKELASVVLEPTHFSPQGNAFDNRYFRDIIFEGENGYNSVKYNRVLPLYGYGDWRTAPFFDPNRYGPRSRAHDLRNPINVDGITFVRGDVFVEGWFEGVGVLVVQGNVYVGGNLESLPMDTAGHPSLWNIAVFEDPWRERGGFTPTDHPSFKKTGHIIIKPHPDNDWSESGGQDPYPRMKFDAAMYAQNGVQTDKEAWRDNSADLGSFDVDFKHNLVLDAVNMNFMPHDIIINGIDPDEDFIKAGGKGFRDYLQPEISTVLKTWVLRSVNENTEDVDDSVE